MKTYCSRLKRCVWYAKRLIEAVRQDKRPRNAYCDRYERTINFGASAKPLQKELHLGETVSPYIALVHREGATGSVQIKGLIFRIWSGCAGKERKVPIRIGTARTAHGVGRG